MKYSIVVPVYNTEPVYFHKCMESLLGQDYAGDYEVILVDDGSAADIGRICDGYGQKDSRITVIHQNNKGVSEARNEGIRKAAGDWLYFVDPDDWVETNMLSLASEVLGKHELDILYMAFEENWEHVAIPRRYGWPDYRNIEESCKESLRLGLLDPSCCNLPCCFGSVCTQFYRVDFLKEKHLAFLPQLRRMQDTVFNLQALETTGRLGVLDQVVYHYRKNPSSICNRYNPAIQDYILEFNEVLYHYIQGREGEWKKAFEYKIVRNYCEILRLYYFNSGWTADRAQKQARWRYLVRNTTYAQYLGKHSYKHILKKSGRYGILLFLTYNMPSFFLLECFWKAYNRIR